jgi:hypothetical protein
MARTLFLRWIEPAFPVFLVAAGVLVAPVFFVTSLEADGTSAAERNAFVAKPLWWREQYTGCALGGHVYSPALIPVWRCGIDAAGFAPGRGVASLPSGADTDAHAAFQ